jgi:hypothetical protein
VAAKKPVGIAPESGGGGLLGKYYRFGWQGKNATTNGVFDQNFCR